MDSPIIPDFNRYKMVGFTHLKSVFLSAEVVVDDAEPRPSNGINPWRYLSTRIKANDFNLNTLLTYRTGIKFRIDSIACQSD